jgi:hypothetical protein
MPQRLHGIQPHRAPCPAPDTLRLQQAEAPQPHIAFCVNGFSVRFRGRWSLKSVGRGKPTKKEGIPDYDENMKRPPSIYILGMTSLGVCTDAAERHGLLLFVRKLIDKVDRLPADEQKNP